MFQPIILLVSPFLFGSALTILTKELRSGNLDGTGFLQLLAEMVNPGLISGISLLPWRPGLFLITFGNAGKSLKSKSLFFRVE